jgi:ER membrane protein complex subunit 10
LEYDGWVNLELYHAIDKDNPEKFILRGNVTVSSLNTGAVLFKLKELAENNMFHA